MSCTCGKTSVRTLAGVPYCEGCAEFIVGPIRAKVNRADGATGFAGIGRPTTPADGYPHGWWSLLCDLCGAGWTGREGGNCPWCDSRYKQALTEQRDLLLRPDLPDDDDPRRNQVVVAWIKRLARGVKAGIVTEPVARRTMERLVGERGERAA
jgi:hypothetical protein